MTFRDEIADLREHGLNDRITSIEIDGNQAWEVCRDINFTGGCRVFTGTIEDLRQEGWNDRISSLRAAGFARGGLGRRGGAMRESRRQRATAAQSRLVLFDRPNYRGDSRDIMNSSSNLGSVGDSARSVQVYGGTWELCEGVFRNARCVTVSRRAGSAEPGTEKRHRSAREVANQSRGRWRSEMEIGRLADWKISRIESSNLPIFQSTDGATGKPTAFISASALLCVTGPGFIR